MGGGEGGGGEGGGVGAVAAPCSNWKSMHTARQSRMLTWKGMATVGMHVTYYTYRGSLLRPCSRS